MAPSGSSHACRRCDLALEFRLDSPEGAAPLNLYPLCSRALHACEWVYTSRGLQLKLARVPHNLLAASFSGRIRPGHRTHEN